MPSLLDIAPVAAETVVIRGDEYPVKGLKIGIAASIVARFPAVKSALLGGGFNLATLGEVSDDVIVAILAAGLGHPNDPEYEAALANLTMDEQAEVFAKIVKATAPGGVVPFVEALAGALGVMAMQQEVLQPDRAGKARSTKSQKS